MKHGWHLLPVLLLSACASSQEGAGASFERFDFANDLGARSYKLYVPSTYDGTPVPLIVELHGCTSNADEEARWSRFNELAERFNVLVAYPEQPQSENGNHCWNWYLPTQQTRVAEEPSLIAGITQQVMQTYNVDAARVYVGGISAGGAMANIMAVTYPDLYAAAMIYAGCEYQGYTCLGAVAATPPETSGRLAHDEMGSRARVVPVIVIHGDRDELVPYPNADLIVQQFLAMDDWSDDGANNASVNRSRTNTYSGQRPGGRAYDVDEYVTPGGCKLAERWLIHEMLHAWSNGESDGSPREDLLTDALGPDVSTPTFQFFLSHPMPQEGTQCFQR